MVKIYPVTVCHSKKTVLSALDLLQVSGRRVGDVVPLEVLREGETCSLEVELQPSQPLVRRLLQQESCRRS
jgi:hypothetical protein